MFRDEDGPVLAKLAQHVLNLRVREVLKHLPNEAHVPRRQVVLDQCQFTDGGSAERVIAHVLDELRGSAMSGSGKVRLKADATTSRRTA